MKKQLLTLLLALGAGAAGHAQDHLYNVASADASALIGRVENPVDYATGTLGVSVPLYTLEYNGLQVPIGLSYRATGIKVEDIAGSVGLGWQLTAGGKITRVVKGFPDEKANESYAAAPDNNARNGGFCNNWGHGDDIGLFKYMTAPMRLFLTNSRYKDYHQLDGEPDLFYFDLPGRSGMFVFDHDAQALTVPYQNISIKWVSLTHFELRDENGTVYLFGSTPEARESTRVTFKNENIRGSFGSDIEGQETMEYVSTWYLESVRDAKGNKITFTYQAGGDLSYTSYATLTTFWCESYNGFYDSRQRDVKVKNKDTQITLLSPKYLKRIATPAASAEFRLQTNLWGYLANASVYNALTVEHIPPVGKSIVRQFGLEYSRFGNCYAPRLDRITETAGGVTRMLCRFTYDTSHLMPPRDSYDVDHWGFYNGRKNTTRMTAIPLTAPSNYPKSGSERYDILDNLTDDAYYRPGGYVFQTDPKIAGANDWDNGGYVPSDNDPDYSAVERLYNCPGANRAPSLEHARTNTLTRIDYPTGGYCEYEYELHDYRKNASATGNRQAGGLRIRAIRCNDGSRTVTTSYRYTTDLQSSLSSGVPVSLVDSKYYFQYGLYWAGNDMGYQYSVSSRSLYNLSDMTGNHVYYSKVIEQRPDASRTVYEYTTPADRECTDLPAYSIDYHDGANPHPVRKVKYGADKSQTKLNSLFWRRGLLKRVTTYDAEGNPVTRIANSYKFGPTKKSVCGYILQSLLGSGVDREFQYQLFVYQWVSEPVCLYQRTVYKGPFNLASESTYEFDTNRMVPTRIVHTDAEGNTTDEQTRYTFDVATASSCPARTPGAALLALKSAGIVAPVEKRVFRNGRLLGAEYTEYGTFGSRTLVARKKSLLLKTPLSVAAAALPWTTFGSDGQPVHPAAVAYDRTVAENISYNSQGNVLQARAGDGNPVCTIYDKTGVQPVATVENAMRAYVTSFEDLDEADCLETPDARTGTRVYTRWFSVDARDFPAGEYELSYWKSTDRGATWQRVAETVTAGTADYFTVGGQFWIDDVRMVPKNARVTSFTWLPGVGKTSEMDEKGCVTYWEYDAFGRLSCVRDNRRNVVEAYDYNFIE